MVITIKWPLISLDRESIKEFEIFEWQVVPQMEQMKTMIKMPILMKLLTILEVAQIELQAATHLQNKEIPTDPFPLQRMKKKVLTLAKKTTYLQLIGKRGKLI
jgi:hypothetical protein